MIWNGCELFSTICGIISVSLWNAVGVISYIFALKKIWMNRVIYVILLCLFPLCLSADEFVVYQVHSNNVLLKTIAEGVIKAKVEGKVSISIVGDVAYITYNSSKRSVELRRASASEGCFFFKKRESHIVKLFMEDSSVSKEVYFVLEKNGKRKMRVTLIRV